MTRTEPDVVVCRRDVRRANGRGSAADLAALGQRGGDRAPVGVDVHRPLCRRGINRRPQRRLRQLGPATAALHLWANGESSTDRRARPPPLAGPCSAESSGRRSARIGCAVAQPKVPAGAPFGRDRTREGWFGSAQPRWRAAPSAVGIDQDSQVPVGSRGVGVRVPPWCWARWRRLVRPLRRVVSPRPVPSSRMSRVSHWGWPVRSTSAVWVWVWAWAWRAMLVRASRSTAGKLSGLRAPDEAGSDLLRLIPVGHTDGDAAAGVGLLYSSAVQQRQQT